MTLTEIIDATEEYIRNKFIPSDRAEEALKELKKISEKGVAIMAMSPETTTTIKKALKLEIQNIDQNIHKIEEIRTFASVSIVGRGDDVYAIVIPKGLVAEFLDKMSESYRKQFQELTEFVEAME